MIGYVAYYALEAVKFIVGYEIIYKERLRKLWLYPLGMVAYSAILLCMEDVSNLDMIIPTLFLLLLITAISIKGSLFKGIQRLLILEVFLNVYDSVWTIIMDICEWLMGDGIRDMLARNLVNIISLVLIWRLGRLIDRVGKRNYHEDKLKIQTGIPYWAALLLNFMLFPMSLLYDLSGMSTKSQTVKYIVIIANLIILEIIRMVVYISRMNDRLSKTIALEKELTDMKTEYYEVLLKKEEDTRRYRHDMMNHYICMKQYAEEGDTAQLTSYINEMMGGLDKIRNETYSVGNQTIEIILNYYLNLLGPEIEKTVLGVVPEELEISSADLSTIFGNLMSNAAEELNRTKGRPGMIRVEFMEGKVFLSIKVSNSVTVKKKVSEEMTVASEKHDSANHGFGLRNVRDVVERNGGRMNVACDDEAFTVSVYIKMKKDEETVS